MQQASLQIAVWTIRTGIDIVYWKGLKNLADDTPSQLKTNRTDSFTLKNEMLEMTESAVNTSESFDNNDLNQEQTSWTYKKWEDEAFQLKIKNTLFTAEEHRHKPRTE